MHPQVYLLALDAIEPQDKSHSGYTLKILEAQTTVGSNVARPVDLCGKDPVHRLIKAIQTAYPKWEPEFSKEPGTTIEQEDRMARIASTADATCRIPNRGIEAISRMKWLFYEFCNSGPAALRQYIPPTTIITLATADSVFNFKENVKQKAYIFKPGDRSRGEGIFRLNEQPTTVEKFRQAVMVQGSLGRSSEAYQDMLPCVLQEYYASDQGGALPVTRFFAAVVLDFSKKNPLTYLVVDPKTAYQHRRIKDGLTDFTLANHTHVAVTLSPEFVNSAKNFLVHYFSALVDKRKKINYRVWESLAKEYIRSNEKLPQAQRKLVLSKFIIALLQEQRFTANRLTHYQCFILLGVIEQFAKEDPRWLRETSLPYMFANSMLVVGNHNLVPYLKEPHYPLNNVFIALQNVLNEHYPGKAANHLRQVTPSCKAVPLPNATKVGPFDYFTRTDIENFCAVDKNYLGMVRGSIY